jgi:hypothetical protein
MKLILILFLIWNCDSPKPALTEEIKISLLCRVAVVCTPDTRGTKFGMIGDSWTDILLGVPVIETLRVQLERYHGYRITGSTLGGQTLNAANSSLLYTRVIDEAGTDIKYMLLSLGGNDLLGSPSGYVGKLEQEKQARFSLLQTNFQQIIQGGNAYKMQKYGGAPLVWIVHGYDYSNPDAKAPEISTTGCRTSYTSVGFTNTEVNNFAPSVLNDFNSFLVNLTRIEPQLRYIDLRGTLGGPPFSNAGNMFDCIHPTSGGFSLLAKKYVAVLQGYTNNEK